MKKRMILVVFIFLVIFSVTGCSNNNSYEGGVSDTSEENTTVEMLSSSTNRLIVYTYSCNITASDLSIAITDLDSIFNGYVDENGLKKGYIVSKEINENVGFITYRIKTDVYNDFIKSLKNIGEISNEVEKGDDITKNYVDLVAFRNAKLAELDRLNALMAMATSTTGILEISNRISTVQTEINKVSSEINTYDTMVEYSKITLSIYEKSTVSNLKFGARVKNALADTIKGVGSFSKSLVIAFIYLFPFIIFFGALLAVVIFFKKKQKIKNKS